MIVNYDDSDGWYDHVYSGVTNPSLSPADNLTNTVLGRSRGDPASRPVRRRARRRRTPLGGQQGRCGFGPRLPMIVDLAVREAERGRPQPERPGLDHQLHRVQLGACPRSPARSTRRSPRSDQTEHVPFDLAGMFDFGHGGDDGHSALGPVQLDPVSGQVDLTNADLSHRNLEHVNLSGAILTGANLEGSHLEDGFLPNANLTNANLRHADLRHADIDGVIWSNTICPDGSNSNSHGSTCMGHL